MNNCLQELFELFIIPCLGIITLYFVKYIQIKKEKILLETNNSLEKKYIEMVATTISNCVIATNQTYVDELKSKGQFDKKAQKIAFQKTMDSILFLLSEDAKKYIEEITGDLIGTITLLIESEVKKNK